ncbi:hypothetical protein G3O06_20915 [Burkholderia sp. Ac-20345]|uniref:hypothetical protein n=1 Tax=Burkholderia sp. Ac-20345 TaxID=2703891 RepID=UPI00197C5BD5|nr:hypothetical protein [Burkholderia sp. Ac-20345]MBN3779999.1 hypothetical protein [Burkholderia sp. Ac-20345]
MPHKTRLIAERTFKWLRYFKQPRFRLERRAAVRGDFYEHQHSQRQLSVTILWLEAGARER